MSLTKERACLVLGYGQKEDGELDSQTRARCAVASELYERCLVDRIYLATGCERNNCPMDLKMFQYLAYEEGVELENLCIFGLGLNTTGEIDTFLKLAKPSADLCVVSSWYHIPRVLWLFWVRGRRVKPFWTSVFSWSDLMIEPIKLLKDILLLGQDKKLVI